MTVGESIIIHDLPHADRAVDQQERRQKGHKEEGGENGENEDALAVKKTAKKEKAKGGQAERKKGLICFFLVVLVL